jgi:methionyl-tRNA formyltransferase
VRAVVFGYHEVGSVCLEELLAGGVQVAALFTHRDNPNEEIWFRTPRVIAEHSNIPVFDPENLKDPAWAGRIRTFDPDYIFSFYYRNMLSREILDIPRVAAMNLHGSLLPKYRGRCPVNWVLLKGEKETGVTLHIMVEKPDAGDIVAQKAVPVAFEDTAGSLAVKLAAAAGNLMRETIPLLESETFVKHPQEGDFSYYGGRKPEDGLIDWTMAATEIYNLIRAVTHPYPGAFTFIEGRKLFFWKAVPVDGHFDNPPGQVVSTRPLVIATGKGLLKILSGQFEGSQEAEAQALAAAFEFDNKSLGGVF